MLTLPKGTSTFSRILTFALAGGILGCIAAILMFGHTKVQGNDTRAMLTIMIPVFCVIGAILGVANAVLFSLLDKFRK